MKKTGKVILIILILFIPILGHAIKFKAITYDGKELTIQAIFDIGFSAEAVADGVGITDYQTVFFKTAFYFQDFGIGFDFDFRFRLFAGDITFRKYDWYVPEESMLNAGLNTFFLYLDKIDYIKYGDLNSPIFFNVGKNPVTTLGTGFLVKNFHNHSFLPTSRELGLIFKFNGNHLDKFKANTIPLDATLIVNDLLDPDIFALDCGVDVFKFTKYKDILSLRLGVSSAFDINSTESNRVSSLSDDENVITSHRNLSTTDYNLFTSFPWFLSAYCDFVWNNKYISLNFFEETGFLFDFLRNGSNFNFGFGAQIGGEIKFINLKNSGYLLGVLTGLIIESPNYFINYFSSNYEILRQKQYLYLSSNLDHTFYILAGLGIYAFDEKIQFRFTMAMPIVSQFASRFSAHFILEDTVVPGLELGVYYETGVNTMYIEGNGGGFIDSLTRDFRFSVEIGYKFYGAKLSILVGVQRPGWVIPAIGDGVNKNPYQELAQGEMVPPSSVDDSYNWNLDFDTYGNDLEKFVSLEISFVF